MYLIFDTETTGLPKKFNAPITDTDNWPRCIQIAWQLHASDGSLIEHKDFLIKPDGFEIPFQSEQIHGISTQLAFEKGLPLIDVLELFNDALSKSTCIVGQNLKFDTNVMGCEFHRFNVENKLQDLPVLDTCTETTAKLCMLPGGRGGKFKLPTLSELHVHLFKTEFKEAHNATADVEATARCFIELIRIGSFRKDELLLDDEQYSDFLDKNKKTVEPLGIKHVNLFNESKKLKKKKQPDSKSENIDIKKVVAELQDVPFSHLHNHSQYSVLQSTIQIKNIINRAVKLGMPAVALTDKGNMMAAFQFMETARSYNKGVEKQIQELEDQQEINDEEINKLKSKKILPILGCQFNICHDLKDKSYKDNGYQVPVLAKNKNGYQNLIRLSSMGFVEGFYYVPRIDKETILKHKNDIIVSTGGIYGEIPQMILNEGETKAEEALLWWKEHFKDDFYIEIVRHGLEEEDKVNEVLLRWADKHSIKYFASNETYYLHQEDYDAHDILLCIKDGERKSTPKGRGRGFRFGFSNNEYYFKSQEEMKTLFADIPEAIKTTNEIIDKCEPYKLSADVLLPEFEIPDEFKDVKDLSDKTLKLGENNYLRHLTYEGAKKRYDDITDEIRERIDFELEIVRNTGYPGYFLIVQDFCSAARDMCVSVGPGRGSAAGSVVAYCTGITNVDPIKYNLLFERFLNPDRISMPDIDIDFDDEGRGRVIQYVIDKYGSSQVAQIITYGTMAAKSSIRDTGRVLDLPLPDTDRLAKLVPDVKLNKLFGWSKEERKEKLNGDQLKNAEQLLAKYEDNDLEGEVVRQAKLVEGSLRNTGIHACGVIITPSDIRDFVPVALAKDSDMWCTQFDNAVAESAGLLKMDFLGLKTLTLIKDTVKIIKAMSGNFLDIESIPLDDEKTYELFQRGETVGIFQYESPGMQKHLKSLRPTAFSDLIAMNALYRPGPIEYIPSFIKRKHGNEEISYDLPEMEEYLQETYGITVYQEQVMLLSQKLAGFSKGEADTLRKAMGKKSFDLLAKMKPKFLEQGNERGHDTEILEKIWKDWEAFAAYAFNKSHSTCYALIAYQTAYLKAHYPAEYMAAVLSNNMNDIKTVTFFMEECNRMGLPVLGPDVNESWYKFAVNDKGEIRFGLGAIKGVGEGPVKNIVDLRKAEGHFYSIFDFVKKVSLKDCNKRVLESLTMAGAFDGFKGLHRAQYFHVDEKQTTLIEKAIKFGHAYQANKNSSQVNMFESLGESIELAEPTIHSSEEWSTFEMLTREKDVVGIYLSGHPLQDYKLELEYFCDINLKALKEHQEQLPEKEYAFIALASSASNLESRRGTKYGVLDLQDMDGQMEFRLFGEQYLKYMHFLVPGNFLYIKGKIQQRPKYYKSDEYQKEFRIQQIELLSDVRDKLTNNLFIRWDYRLLKKEQIDGLNKLFKSYKGKKKITFELLDQETNVVITLNSRSKTVEVANEMLEKLNDFDGYLGFSINKSTMNQYLKNSQFTSNSTVSKKVEALVDI
ncbi:MAG: DNA polymerase III subunit alpha [Crocinitomicaceae bacterium]|nr:DNA polymerase III subunit alpha [Crocinitomicaceae bacterium]